jgi:hypothetical protein
MDGDPKQVLNFARKFRVSAEQAASFRNRSTLIDFICPLAIEGCEEPSFYAIWLIDLLSESDDIGCFISPPVLPALCRRLTESGVPMKRVCITVLKNLLLAKPEILERLVNYGFLANMWNVVDDPDFNLHQENDNLLCDAICDVCDAIYVIIRTPGSKLFFQHIWPIACNLVVSEYGLGIERGLLALCEMVRSGFWPGFNDKMLRALAEMSSEGELILRPFLNLLCVVQDNGQLIMSLCEYGLIDRLLMNIRDRSRNSFLVYRFFTEKGYCPHDLEAFVLDSCDFMSEQTSGFRTQMAILEYFSTIVDKMDRRLIKQLVDRGVVSKLGDAIQIEDNEYLEGCLMLCERIVTVYRSEGTLSETPILLELKTELEAVAGQGEAKFDVMIDNILRLFND